VLKPEPINLKLRKVLTIVERRSRGKLFLAKCRESG
jgi:hypothetical protein